MFGDRMRVKERERERERGGGGNRYFARSSTDPPTPALKFCRLFFPLLISQHRHKHGTMQLNAPIFIIQHASSQVAPPLLIRLLRYLLQRNLLLQVGVSHASSGVGVGGTLWLPPMPKTFNLFPIFFVFRRKLRTRKMGRPDSDLNPSSRKSKRNFRVPGYWGFCRRVPKVKLELNIRSGSRLI